MSNFKDWDYYEFLTFVVVLLIFGLVYSLLFLGYSANTQFSATYKMYLTCRTEAIRAKTHKIQILSVVLFHKEICFSNSTKLVPYIECQ